MILARYTLLVHGPVDVGELDSLRLIELRRTLPELLREAEENLTILLPQDFHVTIEAKEDS